MGVFAKILLNCIKKNQCSDEDQRSKYIFYRIIAYSNQDKKCTLQCINTNAIFHLKLTDIVFDIDILYGLHPLQACNIGIEYAKYIKETNLISIKKNQEQQLNKYPASRYGAFSLTYQNRKGNVCFINQTNNKEFLMDPRDIVASKELIREFDATQAFYIGLLAGLKTDNSITTSNDKFKDANQAHLKLVKGDIN